MNSSFIIKDYTVSFFQRPISKSHVVSRLNAGPRVLREDH